MKHLKLSGLPVSRDYVCKRTFTACTMYNKYIAVGSMGLAWPNSLALKLKPIPSTKSTRGRPQHHLFPLFSGGGASGLHLNRSESGPQVNKIGNY